MEIEVLVSTMNQQSLELTKKMNLNNNVLIINQCDKVDFNQRQSDNSSIRMLTYKERGLSNSRNRAVENAAGDICVLADDDVIYDNDYREKIQGAYDLHKDADIIAFQVIRTGSTRLKKFRNYTSVENYVSCMKISSVEITFKRESILKSGIKFNSLFGAGSHFYLGEESIFLYDCLKKGLKIVYVPVRIGTVSTDESTWFKGYTPHLFKSIGASYYGMSQKWYLFLILQFVIRKYKNYNSSVSMKDVFKNMIMGSIEYKKMKDIQNENS
ncbi:glycosyltransferase family A protein [Neobacillus novalis]|uniref:Glycosyltransferase family A protein n=1 Tax=Neobacillus novalis TaxID=220687 RepID=A0AA95MLB3_9BACI|nr:glycosyltransferase family A protein [Neobacillus novalis]WHY86074.1 glycosyltransferase family A protein [Neobacillus novalis]